MSKNSSVFNRIILGADGTVYVTSADKYLYAFGGGYPTCLAGTGISPLFSSLSNTSGTCVGCSIGYSSVRSLCTHCAKGQYGNKTNAVKCFECSPGTYSAVRTSIRCTPSPAGSCVSSYGSSVSTPCKNGTYSPLIGASECTKCPFGTISYATAAFCTYCSAGQYVTGNQTKCSLCPKGFFSQSGSSVCTACKTGTDASAMGSAVCATCKAGYISNLPGSESCRPCKPGQYSSSTIECKECSWPTISIKGGSAECTFYSFRSSVFELGSSTVLLFLIGIHLFFIGTVTVERISDYERGIIVTKIGVFLFLLLPFLSTLLNVIYLFYTPFSSQNIFIIFTLFITLSPTVMFISFLFLLRAKPRFFIIIVFPFFFIWIIFGLFLLQSKIFTIQKVWDLYFEILTGNNDMNSKDVGLESSFTNRMLLYGSIFETLPLTILQIINNGFANWNYLGILSVIFSISYLIQCFLRFPFDSLNSPISHIPILVTINSIAYLDNNGLRSTRRKGLDNIPSIHAVNDDNLDILDVNSDNHHVIILDCGTSAVVAQVEVVRENITTIQATSTSTSTSTANATSTSTFTSTRSHI